MNIGISPALAERSEAWALHDFVLGAPSPVRAALDMESLRLAGGVVLSMRNDPTEFWSKALGFGFEEPVTAGLIEEVVDFYRSQDTPMAVIQLAPAVLPEDWADICARTNLTAGSSWLKLGCGVDTAMARIADPARPGPDVRISPVEAGQAADWGAVMMRGFGMPAEGYAEMSASSVGRKGWHPYGAWDGDEPVATATMRVHQDTAQFFGAATLPGARRRGAQSGLLAARIRAAKAVNCRWLVAETGVEAPGSHNSSLHNMKRAGFDILYERRNWIWRASGSTR
jgi:hypothetical protein